MPPGTGSRYGLCFGERDEKGRLYLTDRVPFRFQVLPDTRVHVVAEGETLFDLAGRYFEPLPRACGLWWVIADFQPDPIHDPTLALEVGRKVHVPSATQLAAIEAR